VAPCGGAGRTTCSDHVDDEEALRWAALQKLPTRHRVRRAIVLVPPAGDEATAAQHGAVDLDVLSLAPASGARCWSVSCASLTRTTSASS